MLSLVRKTIMFQYSLIRKDYFQFSAVALLNDRVDFCYHLNDVGITKYKVTFCVHSVSCLVLYMLKTK